MSIILRMKPKIEALFTRHLFITNVATCGGLLGVGDLFVQGMGMLMNPKQEKKFDFHRTGRMVVIGFALGPFNHYWYALLDKYVRGSGKTLVFKKIGCDQMVAGPFFCSAFLIGLNFLEGNTWQDAKAEWKQKFLSIYTVDWCFWPAAQYINFRFLPTKYRVVYVSMATLIWNSFLSYMKHGEVAETDEDVR